MHQEDVEEKQLRDKHPNELGFGILELQNRVTKSIYAK